MSSVSLEPAFEPGQNHPQELLDSLRELYSSAENICPQSVRDIYAEDLIFKDPSCYITGIDGFIQHTLSLYKNVIRCEFEYDDDLQMQSSNQACIAWDIILRHKRLNGGKEFTVRGISVVHFAEKIYFQEDFFDLGSAIYEQLPVLGRVVRGIKQRVQT